MTMVLIQTVTLGATAASIGVSAIPNTYTDLFLMIRVKSTYSAATDTLLMAVNGVTTNLVGQQSYGDGAASPNPLSVTTAIMRVAYDVPNFANVFSSATMYVANYKTAFAKHMIIDSVEEGNTTAVFNTYDNHTWNNSAAINAFTFTLLNGTLLAGSSISLYGITTAGATGATV